MGIPRRPRRRCGKASTSAMPSCAGNTNINDASAMLLYEAPSGITVFSFDGAYLNNSVKDFWADVPRLTPEYFLKYETVSTPIDLINNAIDDYLTKNLTRLCGSEKKLAVGRAQYKKIIEDKLGITCIYVGVPDCEVINCSLKNSLRTLFPEEKSEMDKRDSSSIGKELIITLLHQHDFNVKPEMVNESIAELAQHLRDTKLRERELLKFFSILLKDFIVISGIDTKSWMLFQFATVPKMICCPGSSYEIYHPVKIFSCAEYQKIEANASRYKKSFSKIDALSVYEEFVSLHSKKCLQLFYLRSLLKKVEESGEESEDALGKEEDDSSLNKEADDGAENKTEDLDGEHDAGVQSTGDDKTTPASSDIPNSEQLKGQHTDTSVKKNPPKVNGDDANHENTKGDTKIPEITSDDEKDEQARETGVHRTGRDQRVPASSDIPNSEQLKGQHTDTSVKKNLPEVNGDDAKYEKADTKIPATSVTNIPEITSADEEGKQAREAGVQRAGDHETIPISSGMPNSERLKGHAKYEKARDDTKIRATSVRKIPEITSDDEEDNQARVAGVQSTGSDNTIPASGQIPKSVSLKELMCDEMEREANEASSNGNASSVSSQSGKSVQSSIGNASAVSSQSGKSVQSSNGNASSVSSQSGRSVQSSGGKTPPDKVGRRYKILKWLRIPFICCLLTKLAEDTKQ